MRDTPPARDPLVGVELRQAARFAMTLVEEQAKVCQRLYRLVELGFPELRELFDDPTCRTARAVLRLAPTARQATRRQTETLANANKGPGRRRLGETRAERLQAAAADTIAVPELDVETAFEVGLLLDQYDLLERQIEGPTGTSRASWTARPLDCSRRSRGLARQRRRRSWPRSATSVASTTSISSWLMPASTPLNAAPARKAPARRRRGT